VKRLIRKVRDRLGPPDAEAMRFFIKDGYVPRIEPTYFDDAGEEQLGIVHQPHVYLFAAHLARLHGCSHVVDIGCGRAEKLAPLAPEFALVGVDHGPNLAEARHHAPAVELIDFDLERDEPIPLPEAARGGVLVCSDVIEHLVDPTPLLRNLRRALEHAPVAVLSTPERDLARGVEHLGPPDNPHHVREWNLAELERLLISVGLDVLFIGLTASNDDGYPKRTTLAVLEHRSEPPPSDTRAPDDFRVVAFVPTYNEADVIEGTLAALADDGIEAYVVDNWSTDETYAIVERGLGNGVIGAERFPSAGPDVVYDWPAIIGRTEELALELDADWYLHVDADERRSSPWEGVTLRDGVYAVDQRGFNCIDHTVLDFVPVDEGFSPGDDVERYLDHFRFGTRPGHFVQVKAWKNLGCRVERARYYAHDTMFAGRRSFPYKFLNKHYPFRSSAHGRRKVFDERLPRYPQEAVASGIHAHYQALEGDHRFVADREALLLFDEATFNRDFLVERLTGIGIERSEAS
jgi:SAM-dependent methyltransferase